MPKPSTIATWATDSGATSDPGPTRRATGFIAGKKLPAKWLNWLFSQNAAWLTYLRDLHTEPEFLNKSYSWEGAHGFASSVGFFGTAVLGSAVELLYGDDVGAVDFRPRTLMVPLVNAVGTGGGPQASFLGIHRTIDFTTSDHLTVPLNLPTHCFITGFRCSVLGGGAAGNVTLRLVDLAHDKVGSAPPTAVTYGPGTALVAAGALYDQGATDLGILVDNSSHEYWIEVSAKAGQQLRWIEVSFLDPGPRNF